MAFAAVAPFIPALIGAAGSIGAGLLSRRRDQETKQQRLSRETTEELLASLRGEGAFSDLFNASDEAFQKSFVDPARQRFQSQTAPQIQQQFIAGGQQRGTGLDDTLTRAGVDLDTLLNQQFLSFQQGAQNRQGAALNAILGVGAGAPNEQTRGQALGESLGGFLSSDAFGKLIGPGLQGLGRPGAAGQAAPGAAPTSQTTGEIGAPTVQTTQPIAANQQRRRGFAGDFFNSNQFGVA